MSTPALELKGRMLALTRVRLLSSDLAAIRMQLAELAQQSPEAARGMPVLVDADVDVDLAAVWNLLREVGMQPVGVSAGRLADAAGAAGLTVLSDAGEPRGRKSAAAPTAPPPQARTTRIIEQPVRSGQQVYAEGSDLIILGAVSPGAEVIADGCVHAYGPMRGRVIAGARGDEAARVFCRRMEAELVAVGGVYALADQMQNLHGEAVQAYLQEGRLRIEALNGPAAGSGRR